MRWKNQSNLETYGVRLVGWPVDIPMQNPSTLSAAQNTQILNALNDGTMQFLPMRSFGDVPSPTESMHIPDPMGLEETTSEMDDYVKYDDLPTSGPSGGGVAGTSAPLQVKRLIPIGVATTVLTLRLGHIPWGRVFARTLGTFTIFCVLGTFHVRPARQKLASEHWGYATPCIAWRSPLFTSGVDTSRFEAPATPP